MKGFDTPQAYPVLSLSKDQPERESGSSWTAKEQYV